MRRAFVYNSCMYVKFKTAFNLVQSAPHQRVYTVHDGLYNMSRTTYAIKNQNPHARQP